MTRKAHAAGIVLSAAFLSTLILLIASIVLIWLLAGPVVDVRL